MSKQTKDLQWQPLLFLSCCPSVSTTGSAIIYGTILKKNTQLKQQLSYPQRCREHKLRKISHCFCFLLLCFLFARIFLWNWKEPAICSFCTVITSIATVFMMHSWSKTWSAVNPCVCLISIIRSF